MATKKAKPLSRTVKLSYKEKKFKIKAKTKADLLKQISKLVPTQHPLKKGKSRSYAIGGVLFTLFQERP